MSGDQTLKVSFEFISAADELLQVRASSSLGQGKTFTAMPDKEVFLAPNFELGPRPIGLEQAGHQLYNSLIGGEVEELVGDAFHESARNQAVIQFELHFDTDQVELARYPWEILHDRYNRFLVRDGLVDLTRYINYPRRLPYFDPLLFESGLLRVTSTPQDLPTLTKANIPAWIVDQLDHASYEQFAYKLLVERKTCWGLHFDGHGIFRCQCPVCQNSFPEYERICPNCQYTPVYPESFLALEKNKKTELVSAQEFGSVLYNANVQFALMLACETARVGGHWMFNSLAPALILAGVPIVIGMQAPITDHFANEFLRIFYTDLFREHDILSAARHARLVTNSGEWYSPCLYMRHLEPTRDSRSIYQTRKLDTAAPSSVNPGVDFLVKAWLRRPETPALSRKSLGAELGVSATKIKTTETEADIKFVQKPGRKLCQGEVDIRLEAPGCDIQPHQVKLFVSENLDAPAAFFVVRAKKTGIVFLVFSVWQDDEQIANVTQPIRVIETLQAQDDFEVHTFDVEMEDRTSEHLTQPSMAAEKGSGKITKILFLPISPLEMRYTPEDEIRVVNRALGITATQGTFDIIYYPQIAQVDDAYRYLSEYKPTIVHFYGPGRTPGGMISPDAAEQLSYRALARLLTISGDNNIRCIVLSGCYTEELAYAIAEFIDFVVGIPNTITDAGIQIFLGEFYQSLGRGRDIQTAFEIGCIGLHLRNIDHLNLPKLIAKRNDPRDVRLFGGF